jgi:small-conductance mechanosensitive channel
MEEKEDEDKNRIYKEIFWYLSLGVAVILLVYHWQTYFDLSSFTRTINESAPKIAALIIILFIVNISLKISIPIIKKGVSLYFRKEDWRVIRMLYIYFVWFIAFIIIVSGLFGNLSSLGISLSLIGAGVAFALQQVILSFAGWFLILIKRPYKIGDRIYIKGRDILGDVEDITMLFTVLKEVASNDTVTGKNVIIPNSTVFLEPITNYTYDVPQIWVSLPVSVTYESDLTLAEKIIFDVAKKVAGEEMKKAARMIRKKTPESVQLEFATEEPVIRIEFADSSITIRVRIMCLPKQVPALRTEIYRNVFHEFNKPENKDRVEIAYPHMELVFHEEVMSERLRNYLERHHPS